MNKDLKIFDREYVYLNNIAKILYSKLVYISIFIVLSLIITIVSTYIINQNIPHKYKYELIYSPPNLDEEFNTLIKDVSKVQRKLGFNLGQFYYTPEYLFYEIYRNYLVNQNLKRIFHDLYLKDKNIDENKTTFDYKIFNFEDTTDKIRTLIIQIESLDLDLINDYIIKFKKYHEEEFIKYLKKEYIYLIDLRLSEIEMDLKNDIIDIKIAFLKNHLASNDVKDEIETEKITDSMINLMNEKNTYLINHYESMREVVKNNSFIELFNGGAISNLKTYRNDIGYLPIMIITVFFSFIIASFFFLLLNLKSIKN